MSWDSFQFVPGVAARLRLVFLSVSVVLISTMLLGYLQISSLYQTTDTLTETSVPVFVRTQQIEKNLRGLVLSLQTIENVRNVDHLQPLRDSLGGQMRTLQLSIQKLRQHEIAPGSVANMAETLRKAEADIEYLLTLKQEILLVDVLVSEAKARLKTGHDAARKALKSLSDKMPISSNETNLSELAFEIEALVEMAVNLDRISALYAMKAIADEMRSKSQEISVLIRQLSAGAAQDALMAELMPIREVVFGDAGLLNLALRLQPLRQSLSEQSLREHELVAAISASSEHLVWVARTRVNDAALTLEGTADRLIAFLAAASVASIVVFWFANVLIVEKQINQRMSRLTRAVSAIAANELDYDIDVDGNDELGEMAHALETFKSTAEELRRSNTELEKFAYVAAHDLRSPLRAIQDLAEWTMEDEENQFSKEGRENMNLLQKRVDRLNRLLSDLLAYSRVGKESQDRAQISLPQIIQELREMLDPNDTHKIRYSGMSHPVITFATPLRQVLLNLISNSIKHHDADSCDIAVSGELKNGRLLITVQDDGPGIEKQYHDRIFGLFQTLRPRDEVEGSGLGLAIVRKQVDHFGGKIRLTSDPESGRGAKFEFDLPASSSVNREQRIAA